MNGLAKEDLQVYGRKNQVAYPVTGFTFSATTLTGTWIFSPIIGDEVEFTLSNARDVTGVLLDAEWTNPVNIAASNGSVFPSGNGSASGTNTFVLYVTVASADFDRDNDVDGTDFGIWNANKFNEVEWTDEEAFSMGDAAGNLFTDGSDFNIWNVLKFTSYWPATQGFMGGDGGGEGDDSPSAAWLAAFDRLLIHYSIYENGEINQNLTTSDWERFADELMALIGRL